MTLETRSALVGFLFTSPPSRMQGLARGRTVLRAATMKAASHQDPETSGGQRRLEEDRQNVCGAPTVPQRLRGEEEEDGEKAQTEVVWARHTIIWTGQDCPTGNSSRMETKRQTEETMGRQRQRVDWPCMELHTAEREEWRELIVKSTVVPQQSARLRDR